MVKVVHFAMYSGVKEEHVSEGVLDNTVEYVGKKLKTSNINSASKGYKFSSKSDGGVRCPFVIGIVKLPFDN